jgi:hypothetical protein
MEGSFGFNPQESEAHFLVNIPASVTRPVEVSEHLSWDPEKVGLTVHYAAAEEDGRVLVRLARPKWDEIAEALRAEFGARLRREGQKPGQWRPGYNILARLLGKELVLLAWAIEEADPTLIPEAIANWRGLAPEERWWLFTMAAAATGHFDRGRGVGWRKAIRYALTENPVLAATSKRRVVPEFFHVATEAAQLELIPRPPDSETLATAESGATAPAKTPSKRRSRRSAL